MNIPPHQYRGATAMIALHDRYLREFVETWRRAKAAGVQLPQDSGDPNYISLQALLRHVFRSARGYLTWMCEKLELPDPNIIPTWEDYEIEKHIDEYLDHLTDKWATPLKDLPPERFEDQTYLSRWNVPHTIEEMLEHAVMHPIRHTYQLEQLLSEHKKSC